ncbi:MAG: TonB family protein [Proteobacteria bacterium]|nr:TonB family protein [Pseudomonadota bacterium]
MAAALHHPVTAPPSLERFLGLSLAVHVAVMIGLSLSFSHSIRSSPPQTMQVKLIGTPQPTAASNATKPPEEIRTQASAAPREPPPETKNIPPSQATTKLLNQQELAADKKLNPVEAQKRPPTLDKTPDKKKVVKNDLSAKVVKNPEDFLKALDFVDKLEKQNANPVPNTQASDAPAGQGPDLQLNLADSGLVNAIRTHIESNWLIPPGLDTSALTVTVIISVNPQGGITALRISRSSGQTFFDNSLVRAVYKSAPLPIPADKYERFKDMELVFGQAN